MYGIGHDLDFSFLIGRTLEQVCIGFYRVLLQFDEDIVIAIDGEYGIAQDSPAVSERFGTSTRRTSGIVRLVEVIGQSVGAATIGHEDDQDMLALDFGSLILKIYDSNEGHESFNVTAPGQCIVV